MLYIYNVKKKIIYNNICKYEMKWNPAIYGQASTFSLLRVNALCHTG